MEYIGENGFLEELLSLRSGEPLESMAPTEMSEFNNNNGWNYDYSTFGGNPFTASPKNVTFEDYCSLQIDPQILIDSSFGEYITPSDDAILSPQELTDNLCNIYTTSSLLIQSQEDSKLSGSCISSSVADHLLEPLTSIDVDDGEEIFANVLKNLENNMKQVGEPKVEKMDNVMQSSFNVGISNKSQKLNGQPSKNLMAERRRRKRLNDRLSMLRSVVPKISKMDKTSILGDTIAYIKELLQRINMLQEEMDHEGSSDQQDNLVNVFKDVKSNEILARNSPKFDVERRNMETRIKTWCAGKPGLLLSTLSTLEASGLEIQQCVISCFSDFLMQASCNEDAKWRGILTLEDIKHALFRNAGYGGRCL